MNAIMDAILSYDVYVTTLKQSFSQDGGETYFTVNACLDNDDDVIPSVKHLDNEHKRSVWHWNVLRSRLIKVYYLKRLILEKIVNGLHKEHDSYIVIIILI